MKSRALPKPARALFSAVTACVLAIPSVCTAAIDAIAITGQPAPDTTGHNGLFTFFQAPVLNESGQVAFNASGFTGTTGGDTDDEAIYIGTPAGLTQVVREGQPVPDGNGTYSASLSNIPLINDFGNVLFVDTNVQGTTLGITDDDGIFQFRDGTLTQVLRTNPASIEDFVEPSYGNNNRAAVSYRFASASSDDSATVLTNSTTTSLTGFAEGGISFDGNGEYGDLVSSASKPVAVNAAEQVAVRTPLTGTAGGGSDDSTILRSKPIVMITREGRVAPGGGLIGSLTSITNDPLLNANGQVAFLAPLTNTDGGTTDNAAIYHGNGGPLTQIARKGQDVPGGDGRFSVLDRIVDFNEANQVAFTAILTGTVGGTSSDRGVYRGSGGPLTQIARENEPAPDGNGVFDFFDAPPYLNNHGSVVFTGFLRDTAAGAADNYGIFLADGHEVITVARKGQTIDGKTIDKLQIITSRNAGGRSPINDAGQVAFSAEFTTPDAGIFLFTPELHYRSTISSDWDTQNNWTVSIPPSPIHDIIIDPAASVTVTGPNADATVKSLHIGGGTGIATLSLHAGATLTPADGNLTIAPTGVLTGDGTLDADVDNAGTLTADNLTINGTVTSNGTITGSGRINAPILNTTAGTIEALSGQHLRLTSTSAHTNHGRIDVNGQFGLATLEIDAQLNNSPSGRIQVRGNTALRFDGSADNDGIINANFADATISGPVTNDGSIGVAFSNVTFDGGDLTNRGFIAVTDDSSVLFADDVFEDGGAMFVAEGSTVVFFGSYDGSAAGTGHVTILGDLAPGSSPGTSSFGGDLTLSPIASLQIELAGTTPGAQHDQLAVAGTLHAAGTLDVQLLDGYAPALGDRFAVMRYGAITGGFTHVQLPALGHGLALDASGLTTTGTLVVIPEPASVLALALLAVFAPQARGRRYRTGHGSFSKRGHTCHAYTEGCEYPAAPIPFVVRRVSSPSCDGRPAPSASFGVASGVPAVG